MPPTSRQPILNQSGMEGAGAVGIVPGMDTGGDCGDCGAGLSSIVPASLMVMVGTIFALPVSTATSARRQIHYISEQVVRRM